MKRIFFLLLIIFFLSCGRKGVDTESRIITVSIAPFKYFVEAIAGDRYKINIMVPAGANPHIYEPFPEQVAKLRRSEAYISNGYLGFEATWLERFYEANRHMKRLSLGTKIVPIVPEHQHDGEHIEGADPHYWVSPGCALMMASEIKQLLIGLDPQNKQQYENNYLALIDKIEEVDRKAKELFGSVQNRSFMIFHPNLAYLARDYDLEEISVEYEGKEPTPSRLRELIDRARREKLDVILVQKEYDTKNAKAIADETGARVVIIDPLSEDWFGATLAIINALHESLVKQMN